MQNTDNNTNGFSESVRDHIEIPEVDVSTGNEARNENEFATPRTISLAENLNDLPAISFGRSKPGVPNLGYICLSEGVHLRLAIEENNIFIYYLFPNTYISWNNIYKILICVLLNISMNNES